MDGKICIFGDTVLRKRAKPVKNVGESERKLFNEMLSIMRAAGGVGLAAPQIGLSKRMIVIEYNNSLLMIANPKIIKKEGYVSLEEGCLSFPEVSVRVKRSKKIVVEALDKNNKKFVIEADEILARALQHEIDHLDGKLIIDYANLVDKFRIRKRIKDIRAKLKI
ncbi:MAG: peptide deformylase [Candidatus Omnitrophica bacterium]|nr:peptide deformylase [Candidatus Omnitrophota bacterium]HOX53999.1 peptide deformylase [Candidatus Omnitrophota bacterium]